MSVLGPKVPGTGPAKAKIMIVGEAPGREEESERKPFVGYSGRILRQLMLGAGMNEREVYFTNICKYRPPANQLVSWFEPKLGIPEVVVDDGLSELAEEIEAVDPTVIVALGNYALWALAGVAKWNKKKNAETKLPYGYTGIGDWRGSILEGTRLAGGRKVVAAYHPAAIGRKWPWRVYLDHDLKRALAQSEFPDIRRPERKIIVDPDAAGRLRVRERLLAGDSIVHFDIEFIKNRLLCVGFCNSSDEAYVIPTRTASDVQFCREILESGVPLGAQNAMFDCSVLEYHHGIRTFENLKFDTMLASHAAYIELPKDLGTLCSIYTEQPCYWTHIDWAKIKAGQQPISDVYEYNGIDAWVTHEVCKAQQEDELTDPAIARSFEFERSLVKPLWEISKRGVPVNIGRKNGVRAEIEAAISENNEVLAFMAGREVNVMSGPQLRDFLIKDLGLPSVAKTKAGADATNDKALAGMMLAVKNKRQTAALRTIRRIKKDRALISKFFNMELGTDGRFRHQYNPAGTNTGRLSSSKFAPTGEGGNGQNIPRDKRIRSLFVPQEGHTFFYNDLERAESLVVAHLANDPLMLAHHAPGVDAHKKLAMLLFDKPEREIDDDERYMGKQTRHAGNYMQGARTFMNNVNKLADVTGVSITLKEAQFFINRYRDLHVGLGPWWRATEREVRDTGRLFNLLGRMRVFFDRIEDTLPEAVAFRPQSTVGDVLNVGLLRIVADEECLDLGVQPMLQIHDAIGGQVPTHNLAAAMRRMRELMRVELTVPRTEDIFAIPVEITVGPSWGECKVWHDPMEVAA